MRCVADNPHSVAVSRNRIAPSGERTVLSGPQRPAYLPVRLPEAASVLRSRPTMCTDVALGLAIVRHLTNSSSRTGWSSWSPPLAWPATARFANASPRQRTHQGRICFDGKGPNKTARPPAQQDLSSDAHDPDFGSVDRAHRCKNDACPTEQDSSATKKRKPRKTAKAFEKLQPLCGTSGQSCRRTPAHCKWKVEVLHDAFHSYEDLAALPRRSSGSTRPHIDAATILRVYNLVEHTVTLAVVDLRCASNLKILKREMQLYTGLLSQFVEFFATLWYYIRCGKVASMCISTLIELPQMAK